MKMEILSYLAEPLRHVFEPKIVICRVIDAGISLRKKVKFFAAYVDVLMNIYISLVLSSVMNTGCLQLSAAIYVVLLEGTFFLDIDGRGAHIDHATAPTSVEERKICRIYVVGGDLNTTMERLYNPGLVCTYSHPLAC